MSDEVRQIASEKNYEVCDFRALVRLSGSLGKEGLCFMSAM